MAISFAWRSDTSTGKAWKSLTDGRLTARRLGVDVLYQTTTASGIGDNEFYLSSNIGEMIFTGKENADYSKTMSVLSRWAPDYNGSPGLNHHIMGLGGPQMYRAPGIMLIHRTTGPIELWLYDSNGTNRIAGTLISSYSATSGDFQDIFFTFRTDTTTSIFSFYMNGVLQTSPSFTMINTYASIASNTTITLGYNILYGRGLGSHNELVVWDSFVDPTSINTVTPAGTTTTGDTLSGPTRTGWVDVAQADGMSNVDPGVANVLSGTGYTIEGVSLTGSYHDPNYTDPGIANVVSGTSYLFNDSTLTGTFAVTSYTDPGIAQVQVGTNYIFNDSTLTGTLQVPVSASGTAGTVDINNIKEQIRFVLAAANTTTGSPIDLSANLSERVKYIAKVNPEKVHDFTGDIVPAVTVYTDRKDIEQQTIAVNQVNGKREARVRFNIVGMVWVPYTSDFKEDPADDDCELLMENTERVLRSFANLTGNVKWQFPTGVQYHSVAWDEQTHYRVGMMELEARVFY